MIKGIYSAASGMINLLQSNDNIANNLANIQTPGFKKGVSIVKSFSNIMLNKVSYDNPSTSPMKKTLGAISPGSLLSEIAYDFTQGQLKDTGNKTDFAIDGNGFFEVQKENGEKLYTRNGNFKVSDDGYLITKQGEKVFGTNDKPVFLGKDVIDFQVDENGVVLSKTASTIANKNQETNNLEAGNTDMEGYQPVNKLKVVDFDNKKALMKVGNSNFADAGSAGAKVADGYKIKQGALEASNADVITTMVKTIDGMRSYESLARVVEQTGRNLEKTATQLGKI